MPVKHVVMFGLKDDLTPEQIETLKFGLIALKDIIPAIKTYELGVDLKLEAGQKHPGGKNRSMCWSVTFDTIADYETYDTHEAHTTLIKDMIKPFSIPGSRAAVQYEF